MDTIDKPFKFLSTRVIYKSSRISVREDKVLHPSGQEATFSIVEMIPGSSVLPIDENENVLLVKEYKYAVERETVEVISGGIDEGETPLEAAKRELLEETGVKAKEWIALGTLDPFTTIVASPNHLYLAKGLSHFSPHPDEGEIVQCVSVPFNEALRMVNDGTITHSASCVLILKAQTYLHTV